MAKNRYGLSRHIPEAVRREVRRRCGFGCVICGSALQTYEHMDPRFADAKQHIASGITILCGQHQTASSKGLLALETVIAADKDPFCKKSGAAANLLDMGQHRPVILIGGNELTQCGPSISVNGKIMIAVRPPERHSKLWRLSAEFNDPSGKTLCRIEDNEIVVGAENVDFRQTSTRFEISTDQDRDFFELESLPPNGIALNKFTQYTDGGIFKVGREKIALLDEEPTMQAVMSFDGGPKFANCSFNFPKGIDFIVKNKGVTFRPIDDRR
jgi:hypothetical protein